MNNPFTIREGNIKDPGLSRDKRLSWTEEMFDNPGEGGMHLGGGEYSQFLGLGVSLKKIKIFLALAVLFLIILLGRGFYLQVVKGDYYYSLAQGNRLRIMPIKASRGVIFDTNGKQLVKNSPSFNLVITPADLPKDESEKSRVIQDVSALVGTPPEEISKLIEDQKPYIYQPVLIKSGLDYPAILTATFKDIQWPGVTLEEGSRREYMFTDEGGDGKAPPIISLSHVLGYTGQLSKSEYEKYSSQGYFLNDQIGKIGLEFVYEKELKGKNGQKQVEVDALGREKAIVAQNDQLAGQDLTLSLDFNLQKVSEEALRGVLQQYHKQRGAVIIMNPQNGEIKTLVSLPSFDSNDFSQGISSAEYAQLAGNPEKPLFNRAISGAYPSGSTIKPVMAAAALSEGVITPETTFVDTGGIHILQWLFPNYGGIAHGLTNVYKGIAESVNTFFFTIGGGYPHNGNPTQGYDFNGLGPERIVKWLELFGLGKTAGIDLNNEAAGFVPTVDWKNKTTGEQWYIGDTYNLSIGQGNLLVTPLQVANWTAIVANGGKVYRPHLVKKIGEAEVQPEILSQNFIDDKYLAVVRNAMRQTVLSGTGKSFASIPLEIAAKTGTAQWNDNKEPHSWFTCFAPLKNPQIVVTVLVEEGILGETTAASVARQILNYYATTIQQPAPQLQK